MKIKIFRKSQAALEFLTTYGWAFLVILIMIGTLAYFGILSPSKILPARCNFGSELECVDYRITSATATPANEFRIRLKNIVGETVTVTSIALGSETTTSYTCTTPPTMPANWQSGVIQELIWTACNSAAVGFTSGEKGKVLMTVSYYEVKSGTNYGKIVKGEVFTTVQ